MRQAFWSTASRKLSANDVQFVEAELKEVLDPHSLGIHLEVPPEVLEEIEKNYKRDVIRQRLEVIKYWLRNCAEASWTRLAAAVKNMGGHSLLVERLRNREQGKTDPGVVMAITIA